MSGELEQTITIWPGQDDRSSGNGFHCAELLFMLRSKDSCATFAIRTNWLPTSMTKGFIRPESIPKALDLTFHFPAPTLTAIQDRHNKCMYLSKPCHSIVDHKHSQYLLNVLLDEGSDGVWREFKKLFIEELRINNPREI
jgi:hypothetical protein